MFWPVFLENPFSFCRLVISIIRPGSNYKTLQDGSVFCNRSGLAGHQSRRVFIKLEWFYYNSETDSNN